MASKFIKALMSGVGQAINKTKTNVPKTETQKKLRDLKISTQKLKGSKAKLDQSIFEMKTGQPFTFKKSTKKSESNKEAYKRIQKDNTKVIKGMIDKAVENKKDGGRMGLKGGGSDMSSTKNQSINSLKNFLEDRKNRKKSKISKNNFKRDRSPMEVNRVMSKMKSDAQAMGGDVRTAGEMKPLKGESQKSFDSRYKPMKKGGRMGLKKGSFPDHSGDGKITKKDILMAKGVIPKTKSKKKII